MTVEALEVAVREGGGRIVAALSARFRSLDIAEDAFGEACARAAGHWPESGVPHDPAAWLYQVALRSALDALRRRKTIERLMPDAPPPEPTPEDLVMDESRLIPDERLRLIFVCCHPSVAPESRAALTLRLVCGLSVEAIAGAFLISEQALTQRLTRAKRKITDAAIPFEIPGRDAWPERLDAVLSTLEVAYSKAHEDALGAGPFSDYASEVLALTRTLSDLLPENPEVLALAATVRYAEARRPARTDRAGTMVPLAEQNPERWNGRLIAEADLFQERAISAGIVCARAVEAQIHRAWCARKNLSEEAPWRTVLSLYDMLLKIRDDVFVRLNRIVALAEVAGAQSALDELDNLNREQLENFLPYFAVRADIFRRLGKNAEARSAYEAALALGPTTAERAWLQNRCRSLASN